MVYRINFANILFCLCFATISQAQSPKIHPSVSEQFQRQTVVEIVVLMREQADLSAAQQLMTKEAKGAFVFQILRGTAERTQADIQQFLKNQQVPFQSYWIVNCLYLKADRTLALALANRSDVAEIMNNPHTQLDLLPDNTSLPQAENINIPWGISRILADSVWALGFRGQGAVIGGQDTGYDWLHPALRPKYRGFNSTTGLADHNYNWHDAIHPDTGSRGNPCGYNALAPCDDNAHGTHTMGTMVGRTDTDHIGVAPDARWMAARNMDRGDGTPVTYIECFQWFIAPTDLAGRLPSPRLAPHVINNSWSCPPSEGCNPSNFALMDAAIRATRAAGIVVVISAGNSGSGCGSINAPPAIHAPSFDVGATQPDDTIAGFSSRGAVTIDGSNRLKPNVSAPGVGVRSSVLNNGYANFSGTSMAGPHVAGVVALMISANPLIAGHVDSIERILERTAKPLITDQNCQGVRGTQIPNNTYGWGRINALAAVREAIRFVPRGRTSSKEIDNQSFVQAYPNPFSSDLTFYTEGVIGETLIQILSVNGQIVFSQKEKAQDKSTIVCPLPKLPAGIYFYKIQNGEKFWTGKITKH
jgi:hypothetical protein